MSTIYRSIITSKFRTHNLLHFYELVGDDQSPTGKNNVYLSFGKETEWASNESDPGFAPPYPLDTSDGVVDVWSSMIGAVKVKKEYFDAVIPRKDWGDPTYEDGHRMYIGDIVVLNSAPYNQTASGRGMLVYRCVDTPDEGECSIQSIKDKGDCMRMGGVWEADLISTTKPVGGGDAIDTKDGYKWEYLYEIPADVSINRVSNEYIVVPFPDDIKADPIRWGMGNILQTYPDRFDLIYRVRCFTLKFKAYLDSIYFPESSLPKNTGFRQMSVTINPLVKKNQISDPDVVASGDHYKKKDLEPQSGEMIYIENRQPIIRALDQIEEVNLIFEF